MDNTARELKNWCNRIDGSFGTGDTHYSCSVDGEQIYESSHPFPLDHTGSVEVRYHNDHGFEDGKGSFHVSVSDDKNRQWHEFSIGSLEGFVDVSSKHYDSYGGRPNLSSADISTR